MPEAPEAWEALKTVKETIKVKGSEDQIVELKFSRHGPVFFEDTTRHLAYVVRRDLKGLLHEMRSGKTAYVNPGSAGLLINDRPLLGDAKAKVQPEWAEAGQLRKGDYIGLVIPTEVVPVTGLSEDDARLISCRCGRVHFRSAFAV